MSRGGERVGAGRKPTHPPKHVGGPVRVFRPIPPAQAEVVAPALDISAEPPKDMPEAQQEFWSRWAGLAIEKRTLTVHTVPAFRLLCGSAVYMDELKATLDRDGWTFIKISVDGAGVEHQEPKAHPLTSTYGRTVHRVEQSMARFGLAPFGKAEIPLARRAAANPWEKVAQK